MTLQIFVVHSEDEGYILSKIRRATKDNDINFLIAEEHYDPKKSLSEKIEDLIEISNLVLIIWTTSGRSSQWVNQEIGYAKAHGRQMVIFKELSVDLEGFLIGREYIALEGGNITNSIQNLRSKLLLIDKIYAR